MSGTEPVVPPPVPGQPLPLVDERLRRAVPTLRALLEQMQTVLVPAVAVPAPSALAEALFQLHKAAGFVVDAAEVASTPGPSEAVARQGEALEGAHDAAQRAAGYARAGMAEVLDHDTLARRHLQARIDDEGLTGIAERVEVTATLADIEGNLSAVTVHVDVAGDGRVRWHSEDVSLLPIGPRRQLDLAAALRGLAEVLTDAVPDKLSDATSDPG